MIKSFLQEAEEKGRAEGYSKMIRKFKEIFIDSGMKLEQVEKIMLSLARK